MHPLHLSIASHWLSAFNEHNLEKLLALYHEEAVHYSPKLKIRHPETEGLINGREALRAWWQEAFTRLPSLHYRMLTLTANEERVFMEYMREVTGEDDLRVGEVLEIRAGKIIASRVYHS
jgi:limonene-1,2-epoxide hydrolase